MKKIDTTSWRQFCVGELFDIVGGKGITKQEIYEHPGSLPAIQSGEENFGRIGYLDKDYCIAKNYTISKGECLTVARSGSSGYVGYQASQCVVGDSAKILEPKFEANALRLLFVRSTLMVLKAKYAYTDKVTNENYAKAIILLPTKNEEPDWQYMEDYMRNVELRVQSSISALIDTNINRIEINYSYWKEFPVEYLFQVQKCSSKVGQKDTNKEGRVPVYSSETINNGIVGYCDLEPSWIIDEKHPLYLIFGDHTKAFHIADSNFCVADNVKVLLPLHRKMNIKILQYISSVWQKAIPDLGYSRHWSVAKKVKILLPATPSGEPDWHHMEMYMRGVEAIVKNKLALLVPHKQDVAIKDASTVNIIGSNVTYFDQSRTFNVEK